MISELKGLLNNNFRLASGLKGEFVNDINIPNDLVDLSYFAPSCLMGVENIELQSFLEEASTKKRLEKGVELLKKNEILLKDLVSNRFNFGDFSRN